MAWTFLWRQKGHHLLLLKLFSISKDHQCFTSFIMLLILEISQVRLRYLTIVILKNIRGLKMKLTKRTIPQVRFSISEKVNSWPVLLSRELLYYTTMNSHTLVGIVQNSHKEENLIFSISLKYISQPCLKQMVLCVSFRWEKEQSRTGLIQERDLMNSIRRLLYSLNWVLTFSG